MPNANIELLLPRTSIFGFLKGSPLHALLRFAPWLVDKTYGFHPTERILEYPFIHENIPFGGESNILDIGSGSSLLPFELASKGYQVWSIDLKTGYRKSIRHNKFTFVEGDIRHTNFPGAFFDIVTAVSSIEHIGFNGSSVNPKGAKEALQEIARMLRPEGKLLMTTPFGRRGVYSIKGKPAWRVYDLSSLKGLLGSFEIEKMQFALLEDGSWRPATLEEAEAIDSLSESTWFSSKAVAMVVASRPSCEGEQKQ